MIERERLLNAFVDALGRLAGFYAETGRLQDAVDACYRLLSVEPYYEGAHRTLMECHVRAGSPTLALRQYQLCEELLRRKRDARPSPESETLYLRISGSLGIRG